MAKARLSLVSEKELPEGLRPLVVEVAAGSETPLFKFFERLPRDLAADRLDRRRFLLSGPLCAFRDLLREHLDLKFSKGLLVYLEGFRLDWVRDLRPRHGVIPPQDLSFILLPREEVLQLSPALKARHLYFGVEFVGPETLALEVVKSRLPLELEGEPGGERRVLLCASLADLLVHLVKPLLAFPELKGAAEGLLEALRAEAPECLGEI
ncbi:hypothetical protein FVE67_01780 [Thermosulfurimonas marina]|uniref:Uncharacterized protein n=1 Tax=Thermosulfurimonas marina TaxID=2047767 RepID=A0A6H1WQX7_9BACT|nr:hypothetical protein [Thermosulfurimonas marina]QJA05602.1 hypothetical protein FVE67_01780 [Thermosulfurimonas marina]